MEAKYIDSHSHLNLYEDESELKRIIDEMYEKKIKTICIGVDLESSEKAIQLSEQHPDLIYAATGIHPSDVLECKLGLEKTMEILENLIKTRKVTAIGETGLDYYRGSETKELQEQFLVAQIKLAKKYNLPLILHMRDAEDDLIRILKEHQYQNTLIHCFSSDYEYAKKFVELGCSISFSGTVTFKKTEKLQEAATLLPIEKIIVETDAPWLSPVPFRGQQNNPCRIIHVYEKINELRGTDCTNQITKNIINFFKI